MFTSIVKLEMADEFFSHGNGSDLPSISKNGDLIPGSKSDLLHCLERVNKEAATNNMTMDCIILDRAAIVIKGAKE